MGKVQGLSSYFLPEVKTPRDEDSIHVFHLYNYLYKSYITIYFPCL